MLTAWVILLIIFVLLGKGLEFISFSIALLVIAGLIFLFLTGLGALALIFVLI